MKKSVMHVQSNKFFVRNHALVDLSHRCPLGCPRCQRQEHFTNKGKRVIGHDLPMSSIEKMTDRFEGLVFGGQLSDPIHHPKFIEILEMCKEKNVETKVATASSFKTQAWYRKAWQANPDAKWQFGIDGLPSESHLYRINQDGSKLFEVMCDAKNYLNTQPIWQYIIFKFNQGHIKKVKKLARKNNLKLVIMHSSRWLPVYDPLRPSGKFGRESVNGGI